MTTPSSPTERVGRYQLLEPIGIGPSGAVSRAKVFGVAGFERQFAVKRFHTELTATAAMAAMLSAAARAYGSLEHPRIARMSEFGVAQGSTFTAVEYVPGLDALRLISEARLAGVTLAAGGALALVSQAARAVGYAHGRGLAHLGLAPTNVIVTADGDIKITDFGILSATLPPRPIEVPRLAQRIPYLAPEQLANEQATAATDVFALGVLAYELVTGTRTFRGDTPQQVASAIMAGPPSEPALPRPIVRVLQRCLARSPFERFPDGRALADALDAALRVAPVPGTRKDIGVQVKDTLDRLAALNEGQMSGMVALHLGTGPVRRLDEDDIRRPATAREPEVAPDPSVAAPYEIGPADPLGPAGTMPDLPRPITTVPGLPPPPIPVPSGLAGPGNPPPSGPSGAGTLLGLGRATPPAIPTIKPRAGSVSGIPPVPPAARRAQTRPGADFAIPIEPVAPTPLRDASTESAVHPLDPSDLESVDPASLDETVAEPYRPATDDAADGDAGEPVSGPTVSLGPRAADPSMAPPAADDFQDAPTHALTAAAVAEGRRAARYRLDPSSIETKPIPPVTLEPLLFDPIDPTGEDPRPAGRAVGGPTPRDRAAPIDPPTERPLERSLERPTERTLDRAAERARAIATDPPTERTLERPDDRLARATDAPGEPTARSFERAARASDAPRMPAAFDDNSWSEESANRAPTMPAREAPAPGHIPAPVAAERSGAVPGSGRVASPVATERSGAVPGSGRVPSEPKQSQTLLGYPATALRPPTPFPPPPVVPPEHRLPDPLSAMMLEGFRPAPTPPAPEPPTPFHDPGVVPPAEPPDRPALRVSEVAPMPPGWIGAPPSGPTPPQPRRRALWIIAGMLGAAVVGIGAWQLYVQVIAPPSGGPAQVIAAASDAGPATPPDAAAELATVPPDADAVATAPADAARIATASDAATRPADAARVAAVTPDARAPGDARSVPGDAARVAAVTPTPPISSAPGDSLTISSSPPGARVFLDGADSGVTPLKLPGSPDRHTIALLLAGHDLYLAQVDGHGTFQIPLKEVTPNNGPAGIKVLRCKDTERYYVYVDGKPTGQTCPTERIGCEMGPHTVEVYDVVSETRRKWDIVVKETRLSFRVRVE